MFDKKQAASEFHWSKDYVEHLRSIHFSLIIVCVALVVIKTTGTDTNYAKARAQITEILQLRQQLTAQWLHQIIANSVAPSKAPSPMFISFTYGGKKLRGLVPGKQTITTEYIARVPADQRGSRLSPASGRALASIDDEFTNADLQTLVGFHKIWDWLNTTDFRVATWELGSVSDYILLPGQGGYSYVEITRQPFDPEDPYQGEYGFELSPITGKELDAIAAHNSTEYALSAYDAYYGLKDSLEGGLLGISHVKEHPLDVKKAISKNHEELVLGKFEVSFPELDTLTHGLQGAKINELSDWLADQQRQHSSESFEAFGIKFPAEATVNWGMLIIVTIQFYFFLHLRELSPRLSPEDSGLEVPWIGLYKSLASHISFVASMLVLPVITLIVLSLDWRQFAQPLTTHLGIVVTAAITSTAISIISQKHLMRLRLVSKRRAVNQANSRD